jgi:hypothetical protein
MISDEDHERLRTALSDLSVRLAERDDRIADEDEASRTSLTEAWRKFNALARIIDPRQIAAVNEDDRRG